jgi:MFS family permease
VDASTFLLAAICFALVKVPAVKAAGGRNVLADLREGWREFIGRTWLWVVVVGFGVLNAAFVAGMFVLGPAIADQTVGRRMWGLVLAAETVGMVLGGLFALRVRLRHPLRFGVACMLGEVVFLGTLGIAPHPVTLIFAAVLAGMAVEQFGVAWETTMQQEIPADRLARVYSYDMLGSFIATPVGQVTAGPLANLVGLRPAVLLCGALTAVAVLGMLVSRDVRQLRRRVAPEVAEPVTTPA